MIKEAKKSKTDLLKVSTSVGFSLKSKSLMVTFNMLFLEYVIQTL